MDIFGDENDQMNGFQLQTNAYETGTAPHFFKSPELITKPDQVKVANKNKSSDSDSYDSPDDEEDGGFFKEERALIEHDRKIAASGENWWHKEVDTKKESDYSDSYSTYNSNSSSSSSSDIDDDSDIIGNIKPFEVGELLLVKNKKNSYILMDNMNYIIWTIGFLLISLINTGCSFYQVNFKTLPLTVNPFYGPDETTLLSFGAKYGPLISTGEWWRLGTALTIHAGAIHFGVCALIMISLYKLERLKGFWSSMISFLLAGVYGYIVSAMFVPKTVQCGSNGAIIGWLGWDLVSIIASWRVEERICKLILVIFEIIILVTMGFMPLNDNFCNGGGLLMGILIGFTMIPNTAVTKCETNTRLVLALISFPLMSTLFCLALVLYFRYADTDDWCIWCKRLTCINISVINWCPPI